LSSAMAPKQGKGQVRRGSATASAKAAATAPVAAGKRKAAGAAPPAKRVAPAPDAQRVLLGAGTPALPGGCGALPLHDGGQLPVLGFGTYKLKDNECEAAVVAALRAGYRLIDTASIYDNEPAVAQALRNSGVPRSEVVLETKLWRSKHGYESTLKEARLSMKRLGVDYLDLYMVHWPGCKTGWPLKRGTTAPKDWTPEMRVTGTWRAMEDLYLSGKARAIGVCNYSIRHLQEILQNCRVKPHVVQVEIHPRLCQTDLRQFCRKHSIQVQAFSSLGQGLAGLIEDPTICRVASAVSKTPAQVLLRWAVQHGMAILPRSTKPERVLENGQVGRVVLSAKQMQDIDELDEGRRVTWQQKDPDEEE